MAGYIAWVAPRSLASAPPCGGLRPVTNSHTASSRTGSSTCLLQLAVIFFDQMIAAGHAYDGCQRLGEERTGLSGSHP
jgi:hypothetical protein